MKKIIIVVFGLMFVFFGCVLKFDLNDKVV